MKGLRACALSTLVASLLVAQQPNHAGASMVINGTDGPPWPITGVSLPQGQASTVTLQGAPNAVFLVAGSPMAATMPTAWNGGLVDLDLATLFLTFDGLQDPASYSTDASGAWTAALPIPATIALSSQATYQALIANPAAAFGASLSAASSVQVTAGVTTQMIALGDDDSVLFPLAPFGLSLPFYSQSYSHVWINSNGYLSFTQGSTDFTPNPAEFVGQMPRIAGFWTDLAPPQGGIVSVTVDQTAPIPWVRVDFANVAELGAGPPHTFSMQISTLTGDIVLAQSIQNPASQFPTLCGISPGFNLSAHPQRDLSTMNTSPVTGAPDESFYEWFGLTSMAFYTAGFNNPWDLVGTTLTFTGLNAGSAGASYMGTAFP